MPSRTNFRRAILASAGVAVILYSACVVLFAKTSPDVGFRCVFSREVHQISRQPLGMDGLLDGDVVSAVGDKPVPSYLHFHRAIQRLRSVKPSSLPSLDPSDDDTASRALADLPSDVSWVKFGSRYFVRIQFERSQSDATRSAWCEVTAEPARNFAYSLVWFSLEFVVFWLGAIVYWRRPDDAAAALFFELCIVTVGAFMGGYHWSIIVASPWLIFPFVCFGFMLPAVTLHFYWVFPRPKWFVLVYPRLTLLVVRGVPAVLLALMLVLMAATSWKFRMTANTPDVVAQIERLLAWIKFAAIGFVAFSGCVLAACVASLVHSYRRARGNAERNQVKWILCGVLPSVVPFGYTFYLAVTDRVSFALGGATPPMFVASLMFLVAYAISITRYKLLSVGVIVNRGLIYVAISSAVALLYYTVVVAGSVLLGGRLGSEPSLQMLVVSGTVITMLIALGGLRDYVQRVLERRLHREQYQLDRAMQKMGEAVNDLVEPATVAHRMLEAAAEILGLRRAWLYLRGTDDQPFELVACVGDPPSAHQLVASHPLVERLVRQRTVRAVTQPNGTFGTTHRELRSLGADAGHALEYDGRVVGLVFLGAKPSESPFTPEELNFVVAIGQVTTVALHSAERHRMIDGLNRQLKEKLEKISEQQRRIALLQTQLLTREPATPATPAANAAAATERPMSGIIGSSPALAETLDLARRVAASNSVVLVRGESGTGKELLARAIHDSSARSKAPFVSVHCAALSQGLLESELFGHVKGAFTGAHRDRAGRFEMAHGGTLFLDEIGDINLETQTKLLRVLQEMTFERVGSAEPIRVDVRVIAATNQPLEQLISDGRFRADVFYRLNVISIRTPTLRERREDVFELAIAFLERFSQRAGKPTTQIDDDAIDCLRAYDWPGNVRELENVLERAVVLSEGSTLRVQDLPEEVRRASSSSSTTIPFPAAVRWSGAADSSPRTRDTTAYAGGVLAPRRSNAIADAELRQLRDALAGTRGNKAEAARRLGLARSTLFSKLRKYRIA